MRDSELPEKLIHLIRHSLPDFPAAELIVFLAEHAESSWSVEEIIEQLKPRVFTHAAVADYLVFFRRVGLVEEQTDRRFIFRPSSEELAEGIRMLKVAYNEQPVTLIRSIYAMADHPIQSFADSFRIKRDPQ